MNTPEAAPNPAPSWRDGLAVYLQRRVLIVLLLGFSSGLQDNQDAALQIDG